MSVYICVTFEAYIDEKASNLEWKNGDVKIPWNITKGKQDRLYKQGRRDPKKKSVQKIRMHSKKLILDGGVIYSTLTQSVLTNLYTTCRGRCEKRVQFLPP